MQKILEIMKRSLLAKLCLQMFILNFFCMQTVGMVASSVPQRRTYGEDTRVYVCNKPDIDISFNFTKDDFLLSYTSDGQQELLSKKDGIFDGERYVFDFGENFCLSVDEIEHKIFCHRLLANSSVSLSVGTGSLLLYEILCDGLMDLRADNIGILGLVSASQGSVFNASNNLENLGTIDSPQITIMSEQTKNFGKVVGKNVTVDSTFIELNENSVIGASENLDLKSEEISAENASIATKRANIDARKLELNSSVLNVADELTFQGSDFVLRNQSTVKIGSLASINPYGLLDYEKSQQTNVRFLNYDSRFEAGNLKFIGKFFLNSGGEIFLWEDGLVVSKGDIKNIGGKIEVIKNLGLSGKRVINAEEALIEAGFVKITADNGINRKSIIRSLLKNVEIDLKMNGREFISNKYALTNAKSSSLKIPEDEFKGKRFAERQSKYPNPKQEEAKNNNADQKEKNEEKDESKNQEREKKKEAEKDDGKEVGSFLNYSGEIISAAKLQINGSGSLYNVVDSVIESQEDMGLNFYGKILNKGGSEIKSEKDIDMFAKMGMIYFENSKLEAQNSKLESSEIDIDEFSEILGRGKLASTSEKFVNRGNINVKNDIDLKYVQFDNSGKINGKKDIDIRAQAGRDTKQMVFNNQGGEINSENKLTIESINVLFKGKLRAKEYKYKLVNPNARQSAHFINNNVECDHATYDYGVGILKINKDVLLKSPTIFLAGGFYNEAVIKALSKLKIKSQVLQNGYEHNEKDKIKSFNGYNLKRSEYDFQKDNRVSVDPNDRIYIRPEKLESRAAILGEEELEFEAEDYLYNSGTIEGKKKITLNGRKIQTGWAAWEERMLQLPFVEGIQKKYNVHDGVFDFPYDFYTPQKSIIRSYGDMDINCDKFISSFGNVKVDGKLNADIDGLFLNYAGNVMLGKDSHIKAKEFVNTIGAMATNEARHRYWKIATATTDPAALLCNGELKIDVDSYFKNKASYLSAVGDIYLNGKRANDLLNGFDSRFVNESMGTEYTRMYTISGTDVSETSKKFCGVKYGSSKTVTYWWQDINETIEDKVLRGAISSAQKILMQGFDSATNTGVIDAQSIEASNIGGLGFSHGDKSRLKFSAQQSESKKVTVERAVNGSDFLSDYLFENPVTDDVQIPFAIIDDGTISLEELVKAQPAMTIPEYAQMMYRELLKNYSTSRLSDMPTFEVGAQLAEKNTQNQEREIELPHFAKAATKMFTIKPESVKAGIYFRPYRYTDKYYGQITLFPELYLSNDSLHPVLKDSYGAMHSEEDTKIETEGKFHATASMASGGRTEIKAKDVEFETQTYDKHVKTHQHFASAQGGSILGTKTTGTRTKWEKLLASRDPVIISTGKGLGICLQKGGTAEFKGVIGNLKGGYEVKNGNVKLTPLMVNEVSVNENGSYVIPEYLKTVLAVDGNTDLDVEIFENIGSEIRSTGKMRIKAENVMQSVCEQSYKANESYGASQSFFSSRNRHERCYATKFSIPVMTAEEIELQTAKSINLEGLITTEKDLKLMSGGDVSLASRAFYQYLDYEENLSGIIRNARAKRFFSNPQIAPCIIRTGGDYIVEALGNYYQTGVQSKIIGNKAVKAKNTISKPLRVEQKEGIDSEVFTLSLFLPESVLTPAFSMEFTEAGRKLLQQYPLYNAARDLFGNVSQARRASALVNFGIETHNTLKEISQAMERTGGEFTADTATELAARFFGLGGFGWSYTHTQQNSILRYGIPSLDDVGGDLKYKAEEIAEFVGHRAKARNTKVIAGKKIIVRPDVEEKEEGASQRTISSGFNVITEDYSFGASGMNQRQVSQTYHPTSFTSTGINRFEAPQISMTNPLLKAKKNEFIGETEFLTLYNVNKGHSSSFNVGVSSSIKNGHVPMASVGGGRGHYYIESAPEMGVYGDVDIEGYLRNDSVPVYGVITGNYSYSYRAPRYEKDGWGVNLTGLNLSSMDAFGKSFMNAARSALTGYGAGKLAQKLGAGDFASSLIGSLASAWISETTEGLTSQGHISEVHNDKELEIDLIGFNKEQFDAELDQIKQTIFNEAIDYDVPPVVAEQIAKDEVEKIERDVATFKKKAKKVRELVEKASKREAKGKYTAEENTRSSADDIAIDWLLNPLSDEASTSGAHMSELFHEVIREKGNLTPREEMLAYVPKNETEKALKETTLLRYEAEDLIAKHPDAADLFGKIFVGAMYGLQGAEYAGAAIVGATKGAAMGTAGGPVGTVAGGAVGATAAIAGKYVSQEAISFAMDTTIEESSSKAVEGMAVSPALREEFKTTLKVSAYTTLCAGSIKASKKLVGTLAKSAKKGVSQKTFTKEFFANKANDDVFLVNENGIYMSRGKVVNGESFRVGSIIESFTAGPTGRQKEIKTSLFLRKGENPSKRPTWQQSEIDIAMSYRKNGHIVETQKFFKDGKPYKPKPGAEDYIRIDTLIDGKLDVESKNYNLTTNINGLVNDIVKQAIKNNRHLPSGVKQSYVIDARGQVCTPRMEIDIKERIVSRANGILTENDIAIVKE